MLPELAAKITQGRLGSNEFQPDCNVLHWLNQKTPSKRPILMHSGSSPETATLESRGRPVRRLFGGVFERDGGQQTVDMLSRPDAGGIRLNNGGSWRRLSRWRVVSGRSLIRRRQSLPGFVYLSPTPKPDNRKS